MPIIIAQRDGTCRACGKLVRKGEEADFTSELGLAHPEPQCSTAPARHRPNRRAGTCRCGQAVAAGSGRLRLLEDRGAQGGGKRWGVDCAQCASL
ncbi:hypothetical protein JQX13_50425 [Archangium violaceum]|uniref:hypothetical protein n=1 Tax=Archangium violaceum TaxID=83451 RepID=UPI00193C80E0|nr:hypothetical protein [Archangium violaceum]QRK08084.1 hypothetical protein JQX13_50425 [Archangium violaceum]